MDNFIYCSLNQKNCTKKEIVMKKLVSTLLMISIIMTGFSMITFAEEGIVTSKQGSE